MFDVGDNLRDAIEAARSRLKDGQAAVARGQIRLSQRLLRRRRDSTDGAGGNRHRSELLATANGTEAIVDRQPRALR